MQKPTISGLRNFQTCLAAGCALLALATQAQNAPLTAGDPIPLPGTTDKYDFIRFDANANRLIMGHEGNKTFDVFDVSAKKLLKAVATSTSQDAAVDVKNGKYYVSGNDPGRMVIVDSTTLDITGEVPVPSDTDLIAFNPNTGLVYESNDKAGEVWVINPATKKIASTIKYDGTGVEDLTFDAGYKHLYQAVKGNNTIAVVDPVRNRVTASWPCAPDKGVHGIALAPDVNGLLVACAGKLLLFDCAIGKVTATAPTGARVDEIAYDPGLHQAYCASRAGSISVVSVAAGKLTPLGDVPDEKGTGDITVDPGTHTVWIGYAKGDACYALPLTPVAAK